MCEKKAAPYFPLFVNLTGKRVTIVGGGDTARRKAEMLLKFGAKIRVIAPDISSELAELVQKGSVLWLKSKFSPELLEGADLLIAATNFRAVNKEVGNAAKEQRILVSVCDSREESSFIFPAVVRNDTVVAGAVTVDGDLIPAKRLVKKIREIFGSPR